MPWPKEHKTETRERIVDAAAAAFRERGIADVSVGEVMRRAGLTHGGFYAHFDSKDALLAEALARASAQTSGWLVESSDGNPADALLAEANAYLSPQHLAHPERGCPIAALGPELSRGPRGVRQRLGAGIRTRLERLGELVSKRASAKVRRRRAVGALACMIGGIILARGLGEAEGSEVLNECRSFLRDALTQAPDDPR